MRRHLAPGNAPHRRPRLHRADVFGLASRTQRGQPESGEYAGRGRLRQGQALHPDFQLRRPFAPRHLGPLPEAPAEIPAASSRPAATKVPGIAINEHLPKLGRVADLYTIVRSVNHIDNDHAVGTYLALTGYPHPRSRPLGIEPPATPQDMPSLGAVVSKVRPTDGSMFSYVTLGDRRGISSAIMDSMGQNALPGPCVHDPLYRAVCSPAVSVGDLDPHGVVTSTLAPASGPEMAGRLQLLDQLSQAGPSLDATVTMNDLDGHMRVGVRVAIIVGLASRAACLISTVNCKWGPRCVWADAVCPGNCLLARRLAEGGCVPLVTVYSATNVTGIRTAITSPEPAQNGLLPPMDAGFFCRC